MHGHKRLIIKLNASYFVELHLIFNHLMQAIGRTMQGFIAQ